MLLIDGHNLIGKLSNLSLGEKDDEAKLVRMLENYHAVRPFEPILVVFDPARDERGGWGDMRSRGGEVAVRFAPRGQTADDVIAQLVQVAKNPRSITVVSSDNAVQRAVRRHGAKTMLSEDFTQWLAQGGKPRAPKPEAPPPPPEKPEKPADGDVTYWLSYFKEPPPQPPAAPRPPAGAPRRGPAPEPNPLGDKPGAIEDLDYWLRMFNTPRNDEPPKHVPPPVEPPRGKAPRPKPREDVDSTEYWLREMSKKRDDTDA